MYFENKFKMIMNNLRFQINSRNIDICSLLETQFNIKNDENFLNK
jgi:hypothetical protein